MPVAVGWRPSWDAKGSSITWAVLPYAATGDPYPDTDVGVVLMLTRHPSYLPMELMACGCLVVTNRNHWTEWFLKDGENCLLTDPSASCIAETIETALVDAPQREKITDAATLVSQAHSDWRPEMERTYEFLCDPEAETENRKRGIASGR